MNSYEEIDKFSEELDLDTQVDATNIMQRQLSAPNVRHKWLYRLVMAKKELIKLDEQKEVIIAEKLNVSNLPVSNLAARKNVERAPEISVLNVKIRHQELLVDYLDSAVKQMNQIGFDYKNLVELMKLEQL